MPEPHVTKDHIARAQGTSEDVGQIPGLRGRLGTY